MEKSQAGTSEEPKSELMALVRRLHDTQERLRELTQGEVDAVIHPDGPSYLLHEAQEKLRESEARFNGAFENAPIGMALVSPDGRWLKVNRALCELVGYPQEELLTRTFQSITHPDDLLADLEEVHMLLAGKAVSYQLKKRYIHARGHFVTVRLHVSLVRDGEGVPSYFISQIQDITESERAGAELHLKTTLLEAQSEAAFDGILTVSKDGSILGFNRRFAEMWGVAEEIRAGKRDQEILEAGIAQVCEPEKFVQKVEYLYAHPEETAFDEVALLDGRIFDRYTAPVLDPAGQNHGRVWFFRDITARRQAEREAEQSQRKLLEASRYAGMAEVASNVLHNVGNVLNGVNVSAEQIARLIRSSTAEKLNRVSALLNENSGDLGRFLTSDDRGTQLPGYIGLLAHQLADERTSALREVGSLQRSIDHIKEIVTAQQTNARRAGVLELVAAEQIMEDALLIDAPALKLQEIQVTRRFEEGPALLTDKHKVLQILVNLIRNAKDALSNTDTPSRELRLQITYGSENQVSFVVADNGCGIPPENLPRLFEHGFTTGTAGRGFGLHSAALLAQDLGGKLTASSDGPGRGATFVLELPRGE